ncbi:MAG: spermidine synthase [Thermoproteota archaeon]|jgi:spermidine synthase
MTIENGWFTEKAFKETMSKGFKIKEVLYSEKSKYQQIDIIDTEAVGRLMLLDGCTMVSDKDEFVYHEVMAHIPYMVSSKVENVLIIGGGDGGIIREFTKYQDIKKIDLVEIDEQVIEVSKKYFPKIASGLSDARVNILATDGVEFIKTKKNEYDIIVIDSTDPKDFALGLFTNEFYADVFNALTDTGIMMNQTENPFFDEWDLKKIYSNMKELFPIVKSFSAPMVIYPGTFWTFSFCSKKFMPTELNSDKVSRMEKEQEKLQWYNMDWHKAAFSLSNFHKKIIGQI